MNYSTIEQFLKSVCSQTDFEEIVSDYDKYIADGQIGDCKLRRMEKMVASKLTGDSKNIPSTSWFLKIVMGSYKLLYECEKKNHDDFRSRILNVVENY